jgi:hypothetical protein
MCWNMKIEIEKKIKIVVGMTMCGYAYMQHA